MITNRCHFLFSAFVLSTTINNRGIEIDRFLFFIMFENETLLITTTKPTRTPYVKSQPFDSWYIGGLLFMLTVILVLLYANYYRENAFQILWNRFLIKLHLIPTSSQITRSSSNPVINTVLI